MGLDKQARKVLNFIRKNVVNNGLETHTINDHPQASIEGFNQRQIRSTLFYLKEKGYISFKSYVPDEKWEIRLEHKGEYYEDIQQEAIFGLKNIELTELQYDLLCKILKEIRIRASDLFFEEPTVDGLVETLENQQLIVMDEETGVIEIKELGRLAIKQHELNKEINRKSRRRDLIKFVIPVSFSAISLIVSIIAIFK